MKRLLNRDQITGKSVPKWQANGKLSYVMLLGGLVSAGISMYLTPTVVKDNDLNVMELIEATALISWSMTLIVLLSYTCMPKEEQVNLDSLGTTNDGAQPINEISEDIKFQLHEKLSQL